MHLKEVGVWRLVDGTDPRLASKGLAEGDEETERKLMKASQIITTSISRERQAHIRGMEDPKAIWDRLAQIRYIPVRAPSDCRMS